MNAKNTLRVLALLGTVSAASAETTGPSPSHAPTFGPSSFPSQARIIVSYFALDNDPMQPGWNKRVWNTVEYTAGRSIVHAGGGDVTLASNGLYRFSGVSIVTYMNLEDPTNTPTAGYAGYCELQKSATAERLATGTISNAASAVPSSFEAYVTVKASEAPLNVSVVHQVGQNTTNVWLGLSANGSNNHVFARLTVEYLGDPS